MSDITEQIVANAQLRDLIKQFSEETVRLRAENETLRRDVKTAVMGDSAELADMKNENERLREALKTVCRGVVSEREGLDWFIMDGAALRVARAAIEGNVNE